MNSLKKYTLVLATGLSLVVILFVTFSVAATTSENVVPVLREPAGEIGGNFRFPLQEPESLDPALIQDDSPALAPAGQLFEGLTKLDNSNRVQPAMAVSWSTADAQNWSFVIRPGARFHNGREITPDDVVFSWNRVAAEGNEWYEYLVAPYIDSVTADNAAGRVDVTLTEPFGPFPSLLAMPFMAIVPPEAVGSLDTDPVGSGPFQFDSWTPGDSMVVSAFSDYYAGRPFLDTITYQFFLDDHSKLDAYLMGNVDYAPVPSDRLDELAGDPNLGLVNELAVRGVWMKVDQPPTDDVRVRRALNYAADLADIITNDLPPDLLGYPADGPVPPGMQGYNPPVPTYPYSPTRALVLLADAGWTDTNGDNILDDGLGTDLTLEIWHPTDNPTYEPLVHGLADDWRDIGGGGLGATVVISHTDWPTYLNELDNYPMHTLGWGVDYPDPNSILSPLFGPQDHFFTHYDNPEVFAWLEAARTEPDMSTRLALYALAENQIQLDVPAGNLIHSNRAWVHGPDVQGMVLPAGFGVDEAAIQMELVQLVQHFYDMAIDSLLQPKGIMAPAPFAPVVKVRNAGLDEEVNVTVHCWIEDDAGTLQYDETVILPLIAPSVTMVVDLPQWMGASTTGQWHIECETQLPGDENPANDAFGRDFVTSDLEDGLTRDHNADIGLVPTFDWWQSPDIIVRHNDDGIRIHQDPIMGQTNTVYVRVKNIGGQVINDGVVNVYWHEPSAAIMCGDWAPINTTPIPLPAIAAGEHVWVKTEWVPPIEGHTCLNSTFDSGGDPVTMACDVSWDNNISQRNIEVVPLTGGGGGLLPLTLSEAMMTFDVANIHNVAAEADLTIERASFPAGGTLVLEMGNTLFNRWLAEGGQVSGGTVIAGTTSIALTDPVQSTVHGLPLNAREIQPIILRVTADVGENYELLVRESIHDVVVGGMTYRSVIEGALYLPVMLKP